MSRRPATALLLLAISVVSSGCWIRETRPTPAPQVFLDGKPFPERTRFDPRLPIPLRTLYVSAKTGRGGDGSPTRPWGDLQSDICRLNPGDRLILLPGTYKGPFRVEGSCRDGREGAPIQVIARPGAVLRAASDAPLLAVQKAHWIFQGLTMDLNRSSSTGVQVGGESAHDIIFDRGELRNGLGMAIYLGYGTKNLTISNSRIRGFHGQGTAEASGVIQLTPATREIALIANEIYDISGVLVQVEGPHGRGRDMKALAEKLSILGNTISFREGPGIALRGCRNVRISGNTIQSASSTHHPEALAIWTDENVKDLVVEQNHITGSTVGIHLGPLEPGDEETGPRNVLVLRNYLENPLDGQGIGIRMASGLNVRIYNNAIDRYGVALTIRASPSPEEGFSIANNILLDASVLAFKVSNITAAKYFDHNRFSWKGGRGRAQVDGKTFDLREYLASGQMPNTKIQEIQLIDRDLGRLRANGLVDGGKEFRGIAFAGSAPDIGVAER